MIVLLMFILSNCYGGLVKLNTKGVVDDLLKNPLSYIGNSAVAFDRSEVIGIMNKFLEHPEELENPLALSVCDRISFMHLLFSVKSNEGLFDLVYRELFNKHKQLKEEPIFKLKTELGYNIIHITIKYANQRGFERIKEIDKKRDLKKYFLSTDILGKDTLNLASSIFAAVLVNSYENDNSYYDKDSVSFLKDAILYMISKKYFLNNRGLLSENEHGRNFLIEAIDTFTKKNLNGFGFNYKYVEEFFSTFRMFFINLLINLQGNSRALDSLIGWERSVQTKVPPILRDKLDVLIEKIEFIHKINKYSALHRNKKGLLPIEEAIEMNNEESVAFLINIKDCNYPNRVYERIISKKSVDMFNLIPKKYLNYRILAQIKELNNKELENVFMNKIGATELERLIAEAAISEIKEKSIEWLAENYRDERGNGNRRINTTEMLCIFMEESLMDLIDIIEKEKGDIREYALFTASKLGKTSLVDHLLIEESEINESIEGALMLASQNGQKEVCRLLLDRGARVDTTNNDREGPLLLSSESGHKEVCELLLERGAKVDVAKSGGQTALMLAAKNGHRDICKLLLNRGAEIEAADHFGSRALILAAESGHREVCELLLKIGAEVDIARNDGCSTLMLAAKNGHKEVCELLLENGVEVDALSEDGKTALMLAAERGHKEVGELLLFRRAEIDILDEDGKTALILAAQNGHEEISELLLSKGANIDISDKDGKTSLMLAAENGHKKVCKLLLEKGANMDVSGKDGKTALMLAAENGHEEECELLTRRVPGVDASDKDEKTALMLAAENGHREVCELLLWRLPRIDAVQIGEKTPLMLAAENGHEEVCALLLEWEENLDYSDRCGFTALMLAAENGNKEVCELLLEKGGNVDAVSKDGQTSLMLAAKNGHEEICELLLQKEAAIDIVSNDGKTALMLATENGKRGVCRLLLPRANSKFNMQGSALHIPTQEVHLKKRGQV